MDLKIRPLFKIIIGRTNKLCVKSSFPTTLCRMSILKKFKPRDEVLKRILLFTLRYELKYFSMSKIASYC